MTSRTTITLSRDVPKGGDIAATEAELLIQLGQVLDDVFSAPGATVVHEPAPFHSSPTGGYVPVMGPGGLTATVVEVRAVIEE